MLARRFAWSHWMYALSALVPGRRQQTQTRCRRLAIGLWVLASAAATAGPVVSVPLAPATLDDFIQWKPQTRTDQYGGTAVLVPPAPDTLRGTATIGARVTIGGGGPVFNPFGPPGGVSVNLIGSLSTPVVPNGTLGLSTQTSTAAVLGNSFSGYRWSVQQTLNFGFSPSSPTGWGKAMWDWSTSPVTPPATLSITSTVNGNAAFNSPGFTASVSFEEASLVFQPWLTKVYVEELARQVDSLAIGLGARDSQGNYVPIEDMARAMGFDHFNFVNIIHSAKKWNQVGNAWEDTPVFNCRNQAVNLTARGLYDPVPCGNLGLTRGDDEPYYYNVRRDGDALLLDDSAYGPGVYATLSDKSDGSFSVSPLAGASDSATGLMFVDSPSGVWAQFSTFLVGVTKDGFTQVGDRVYEWESVDGQISHYTERTGTPPPLPPRDPSGPVRLAAFTELGELDRDDEFALPALTFSQFEAKYGMQPEAWLRAIQTESTNSQSVASPGSLSLVLAALVLTASTRRPRLRSRPH